MRKRGQSSVEFTALIGFMFFVFLVFFYVVGSRFATIRTENDKLMLNDFGDYVKTEISLAASAADGYSRTFFIPKDLNGRKYEININEYTGTSLNFSEMTLVFVNYSLDYMYVVKLPKGVMGDIDQYKNTTVLVRKIGNSVYIRPNGTCEDSCNPGDRICDGTSYRVCIRDGDADACFEYGTLISCGELSCIGGYCTEGCTPSAEICDGIDNDCDGPADEIFTNLGQSCTVGEGTCISTGVYVCNAGHTGTVCDAVPGSGTPEICNNADDDCDTLIDESLIQNYSCGIGACIRNVSQTCSAGIWSPACVPGAAGNETCNNIDDDCDTLIDEFLNQTYYCGTGACRRNVSQTCSAGIWSPNCTQGTPVNETCNNIDDDCDGPVDESLSRTSSCGTGACYRSVSQTCSAGAWSPACVQGTPVNETCNNIDDDCDTLIDESLSRTSSCGTGACFRSVSQTCSAGAWSPACVPGTAGTETCNNIDDDCDGSVDESLTRTTSCGTGACYRSVSQTCSAGAWSPACVPGAAGTETCNNIDDDCDGSVDESLSRTSSCGVGACYRSVSQTCSAGAWSPACVPYSPTTELCSDGIDNDCDGFTDSADSDCSCDLCTPGSISCATDYSYYTCVYTGGCWVWGTMQETCMYDCIDNGDSDYCS